MRFRGGGGLDQDSRRRVDVAWYENLAVCRSDLLALRAAMPPTAVSRKLESEV